MSIKKISFLLISLSFFLVSCGGGGSGTAASGNPYGGGTPASSCSSDYCITVVNTASGNKYAVNGSTQAAITITAGQTKTFDLSDSSLASHPFALSKRADGRDASEVVVVADTLGTSDGVTTASNVLTIVSSSSTSTPLYYYCSSHAGMGGTITVSGGTSTGYEVPEKVQPIDT